MSYVLTERSQQAPRWPTSQRFWPCLAASLILHGAVLAGGGWLCARYQAPRPCFQPGEFSLELLAGETRAAEAAAPEAATPAAAMPPAAAAPPPAPLAVSAVPPPAVKPPPAASAAPALPPPRPIPAPTKRAAAPVAAPTAKPAAKPVLAAAPPGGATGAPEARQSDSGSAGSGALRAPSLSGQLSPVYPAGARRRGEEGRVAIRAAVTAAGRVASAEVIASSGFPALDQAALHAVRRAEFLPARRGPVPVAAETELAFRFTLVD